MIGWVMATPLGRTVAGLGAVIAAFGLAFLFGRRAGARHLKRKMEERDRDNAEAIRRRVRRARDRGVQPAEVIYRD